MVFTSPSTPGPPLVSSCDGAELCLEHLWPHAQTDADTLQCARIRLIRIADPGRVPPRIAAHDALHLKRAWNAGGLPYTGTVAAVEETAGVHGLQASKRPGGGLLAASGVPGSGGAISVSAQLAHLQRLVSVTVLLEKCTPQCACSLSL